MITVRFQILEYKFVTVYKAIIIYQITGMTQYNEHLINVINMPKRETREISC